MTNPNEQMYSEAIDKSTDEEHESARKQITRCQKKSKILQIATQIYI